MIPRYYQLEAVESVYDSWQHHPDQNVCINLFTALGKSVIIGMLAKDFNDAGGRCIVLAHVKELLEQNADKIRKCGVDDIGIYSAGLGRRDKFNKVLVAGIQSVYDKVVEIGRFDLAIIDEAHTIGTDEDGRYRQFIAAQQKINPNFRVVGLTATPFRMKSGPICSVEGPLHRICYSFPVRKAIDEGFLSPLISKAGQGRPEHIDDMHIRNGEFAPEEVDAMFTAEGKVKAAMDDVFRQADGRKSILVFGSSIKHCNQICEYIDAKADVTLYGGNSGASYRMVTGDTESGYRNDAVDDFRAGKYRFLVNMGVYTTGFDAPNVDCVVLLRPTASPGLYVQMVGRGVRISEGKHNCLVLDYGDNVVRHGPVDMVKGEQPKGSKGGGTAPVKECPQCNTYNHAARRICEQCGYVWPAIEHKHTTTASDANVLSGGVPVLCRYPVAEVYYSLHKKEGKTPSICVEYNVGPGKYIKEWVCAFHEGYARVKAEKWWNARCDEECPLPVSESEADYDTTLKLCAFVSKPTEIEVDESERFPKITKYYGLTRKNIDAAMAERSEQDEANLLVPIVPDDDIPF